MLPVVRDTFRKRRSESFRRIEPIIAFMMQNLANPISVGRLSQMAGVSPSTFFALFRAATGYSPNDYFTRARMQRAGQLLQTGNLSVKEVAAMMGYDDPFYFSRRFKSAHGIAPLGYRRNQSGATRDSSNGEVVVHLTTKDRLVAAAPPTERSALFRTSNEPLSR
jgi:transcriptional regulator GlxA family with amidase domain